MASSSSASSSSASSSSAAAARLIEPDDVVVFVDYHENSAVNSLPFIAALERAAPAYAHVHVHVCTLATADVLVSRVMPRLGHESVPSASDADADADAKLVAAQARAVAELAATVSALRRPQTALLALLGADGAHVLETVGAYERKTITDLVHSVRTRKDVPTENHWSKQCTELTRFCATTGARPGLLLEGYIEQAVTKKLVSNMTEPAVHAVLVSAYYGRGFPPWQSSGAADSARHVLEVASLTRRRGYAPGTWVRATRTGDESLVQTRKERNKDIGAYFVNILAAVPGMSVPSARVVAARYPSVPTLVAALTAEPSFRARVTLLADVRAPGSSRRLGESTAAAVVARYAPTEAEDEAVIEATLADLRRERARTAAAERKRARKR